MLRKNICVLAFLVCAASSALGAARGDVKRQIIPIPFKSGAAREMPDYPKAVPAQIVGIPPGSAHAFTRRDTFSPSVIAQIEALGIRTTMPDFMAFDVVQVRREGNDIVTNYRIGVYLGAPAGVYTVELVFDYMDDSQMILASRNFSHDIDTSGQSLPDDYGNICSEATQIVPGQTIGGNLVVGDIDFFGIVVDTPGTLTAFTTGQIDTFGELRDADCNVLAINDDGGTGLNFRIEMPLGAGVYFISVRHFSFNGTGDYTLHAQLSAGVTDDHGNNCAEATQIAPNQNIDGALFAGDHDYFGLVLNAPGDLTAFTTGQSDTFGELRDADCNVLTMDDDSGEGLNFQIEAQLTPGLYFISIRHFAPTGSGDYTLNVQFAGMGDDHGNTCAEATQIGLNQSMGGQIDPSDVDYFGFAVTTQGDLRAYTTGQTDTFGLLLDAACNTLDTNDDGGEGLNFRIEQPIGPGVYFVAVRHFSSGGSGPYTLHLEFLGGGLTADNGILYPQLAVGSGWMVVVMATNLSPSVWNGRASLDGETWPASREWSLNGVDYTGHAGFDIQLGPNETRRFVMGRNGPAVEGWFEIREGAASEISDLVVSFFYNFSSRGVLVDSTGVLPSPASRTFRFCVERSASVNTGMAIRRSSAPLQATLYDQFGQAVSTVGFTGDGATFFSDLFAGLPADFLGSLEVASSQPFYLTVLRLEFVPGGFQLTSAQPWAEQ